MEKKTRSPLDIVRPIALAVFFAACSVLGYLIFGQSTALASKNEAQQLLYPLGLGMMLSALLTAALALLVKKRKPTPRPAWFYPALAALLTCCGLGIAYIFLGIWPVGEKSCMLVDMHHQYAPLLFKLRNMLLSGENFLYSFELGLGASVLPAFAYYLASPLNLLLVLFPEHLLTEGIFVITMLKNMLIAASCAACLQYVYRRRTPAVAVVSLMYAMMMYVLAYSWNIMWLDGLIALPLAVMGFEYLMRQGRYLPYILSLAYALLTNYYIAFMLCIFLVLYFFVFLMRDRRDAALNRRALWRFTVGSLLGGGLAMIIVLPTALALGQTSAAGSSMPDMSNYFDMFNLLGRHLYAVSPTIRSGKLPNVYCGVAVLLLVPLFAVNRGIPRRRRIAYLLLTGVMAVSLVINQINLLWHGTHAPNDLPYRFSFLYCFVLLLISYETLMNIRHIQPRQLIACFGGVLAYLLLEERFGDDAYGFTSIYVTLLLAALYALICWMLARRVVLKRVGYLLMLVVVSAELTLNASQTFIKLNSQEHFTAHSNYVDSREADGVCAAVDKMKMYQTETGDAFSRMEFLPRRTCMDTALFDYPGVTSFASSNSYRTTRLMGALGYDVNGVNSYLYKSFIPVTDSLLGVRYVALQTELTSHPQLTLLDQVSVERDGGTSTYYIYENKAALPLAYRADYAVKEWASSYYSPYKTINSLYTAMTGDENAVLAAMPISSDDDVTIKDDCGFYIAPSGNTTAAFRAEADMDGQYFIYVDCRGADSISVSQGSNSWTVSPHSPFIIDAGSLLAGDGVDVFVTTKNTCSGNVYVMRLDSDMFDRAVSALSADGMTITDFSDRHITGTINASANGTMVTSIPYDAGWSVKVDGQDVATYGLDTALPTGGEETGEGAAMLGFDIPAGSHTVELTFTPRGLTVGIVISIVSLLAVVALALLTGKWGARVQDTPVAWMVETTSLDPHNPYLTTKREEGE